jgi:hypothetical protein
MRFTSKLALRVAAFGVAAAAIGLPITAAQATTAPALTATPSTGLTNGQSVAVSGTNFADTAMYYLVECSALTGAAACDEADVVTGTTTATGTLAHAFVVKTGAIGTGTCPVGGTCYLVATTNPDDPSAAGSTPITFATPSPVVTVTPSTKLRGGQTIHVSGSGFPQHNAPLYIVECNSETKGQDACAISTLTTSTTSATGTFSGVAFKVVTGTVGTSPDAGQCVAGKTCFIAASTSTSGVKADSGAAPITFAKVTATTIKTTTSARASAKRVAHGRKFTISGAIRAAGKGVSGLKATLYKRANVHRRWKKVTTFTTNPGGKFRSSKIKGPKKSEQYLVRHLRQRDGTVIFGASNSKVITVKK